MTGCGTRTGSIMCLEEERPGSLISVLWGGNKGNKGSVSCKKLRFLEPSKNNVDRREKEGGEVF